MPPDRLPDAAPPAEPMSAAIAYEVEQLQSLSSEEVRRPTTLHDVLPELREIRSLLADLARSFA